MIALLQRVSSASVDIGARRVAEIGSGLLVFVGVERADGEQQVARLLQRVLLYRVFDDERGRMNLCLSDTGGGLLLVPQFTLAADTRSGTRAGFSRAAAPAEARILFDHLVERARARQPGTQAGEFGAVMQVALVNDGPVTFWLEAR